MRDHATRVCGVATIVYMRERGLWRFSKRLNNGDGKEHSREAKSETPLAHEERSQLSLELPDWELGPSVDYSCEGLQRGLVRSLHAS